MTLTRGWRHILTATLVILAASVLLVWGNQRQVQAQVSGGDIAHSVFCLLNGAGEPVNVFDDECEDGGGEIIDWCPDVLGNQSFEDLPCEEETPAQCGDGLDNDGDGKIDWHSIPGEGDPGCSSGLDDSEEDDEPAPPACSDGEDNDGDELVDMDDPGCEDEDDTSEVDPVTPAQCADGLDNDSDGLTDLADPGCEDASDNDETDPATPAQCADGLDNDNDGKIDMEDPGCANAGDNDETNTNGGGGDEPECNDGLDNDNDGRTDMDDDGCESASDDDETDEEVSSSSGGSGGRRGGLVLGEATVYFSCDQFLTAYIRSGQANDLGQVARLQYFLNEFEGASLTVNGVYDAATLAAVNAFQSKYASEVLTPWGISGPTGYVYFTTRKKINELYCKGTNQFPLTAAQQQIITQTRAGVAPSTQAQARPTLTLPADVLNEVLPEATNTTSEQEKPSEQEERELDGQPRSGFWGSIGNFFGGLFGGDR